MSSADNTFLNNDKLLEQSLALKTASKQLLEQQLLSSVPAGDVEEPLSQESQMLSEARNEANWYKNEYVKTYLNNLKKKSNLKDLFSVPHLSDPAEKPVFENEQKLLVACAKSTETVGQLMGTVPQYLKMIHHIYAHARSCALEECEYEQQCWRMQGLWWHTVKLEKRGRLDAGAMASLWNKQLDLEMHMDYCTQPLCECTDIEQYRYFFMKRINEVRTRKYPPYPPNSHPFAVLLRHFKAKVELALMNGKEDPECRSTAYLYFKLASMDIGPNGKERASMSWAEFTAAAQGTKQQPAAAPTVPVRLPPDTARGARPVLTKADPPIPVLKSGDAAVPRKTTSLTETANPPPNSPTEENPIPANCKLTVAQVAEGQRVQLIRYPDNRLKRRDDPNGPYVTLPQLREEYKRSVAKECAAMPQARKQTALRNPDLACTENEKEEIRLRREKQQPSCDHAVEKKCNCTYGESVVEPKYESIQMFEKEPRGAPPTKAEMDELRKRISDIVARRGVETDVKGGDKKSVVRVVTCSINGVKWRVAYQGDIHNHFNRDRFNDTVAKYIFAANFLRDVRILFYNFAPDWGSEGDKRMLALLKTISKLALPYNLNYVSTVQADELQVKFLLAKEQIMKRAAVIMAVEKAEKSKDKKAQLRRERESLWFSGTHVMVTGKDLKQNWKMRLEEDISYFGNLMFDMCTLCFSDHERTSVLMSELSCLRVYASLARWDQVNENGKAAEDIQTGHMYQQAVETKPLRTVKAQVNWVLSQKYEDISHPADAEIFVMEQMVKMLNAANCRVQDGEAKVSEFMAGFSAMAEAGLVWDKEELAKLLASPEVRALAETGKWPIDEHGCPRAPPDLYRLCYDAVAKSVNMPPATATQPKQAPAGIQCKHAQVPQQQPPQQKNAPCEVCLRHAKIAMRATQSEKEEMKRSAENVAKVREMVERSCSDEDAELSVISHQMMAEVQKIGSLSSALAISRAEIEKMEKMMYDAQSRSDAPPSKTADNVQTNSTVEAAPVQAKERTGIDEFCLDFDKIMGIREVDDQSKDLHSVGRLLELFPGFDFDLFMKTFDPRIAIRWARMRMRRRGEVDVVKDLTYVDEAMRMLLAELNLWRIERESKTNGKTGAPGIAFSEDEEQQHCADEAYIAELMEKVYAVTKVSLEEVEVAADPEMIMMDAEEIAKEQVREALRQQWVMCKEGEQVDETSLPVDDETFDKMWQFMLTGDGEDWRANGEQFKIFPRLNAGGRGLEKLNPPVETSELDAFRKMEMEVIKKMLEAEETETTKEQKDAGTYEDESELDEMTKKYDEYFRQRGKIAMKAKDELQQRADDKEQDRLSKLSLEERGFENRTQKIVDYTADIERLQAEELDILLKCIMEREAGWKDEVYEQIKPGELVEFDAILQSIRFSIFQRKMNIKNLLHLNGRSDEAEEMDKKGEHEVKASCIVDDWCKKLARMEKECARKLTQAQKLTRKERMKVQAKVDPELQRIKDEQEIMVKMKYDAVFWYEDKVASLRTGTRNDAISKNPEEEKEKYGDLRDDRSYSCLSEDSEDDVEEGPNESPQGIRSKPLSAIDDPSNRSYSSGDE